MPTSRYAQGTSFENDIKKYLTNRGYFVIRSAGSKGLVDLAVFRKPDWGWDKTCFIQAKKTGLISVAEWNNLVDLAYEHDTVPILAQKSPVRGRGILFYQLTGHRIKYKREQPMKPFNFPDLNKE